MLHILGLIGKGIGIALLGIVIVLIVLVLACLFVPIRYRAEGERKPEKAEEGRLTGKIGIHWLLYMVSVLVVWKEKRQVVVRLFGIPVYDNLRKKKRRKKAERKEKSTLRKNKLNKSRLKKNESEKNKLKKNKSSESKVKKDPVREEGSGEECKKENIKENSIRECRTDRVTKVSEPEKWESPSQEQLPELNEQRDCTEQKEKFFRRFGAFFQKLFSLFKSIFLLIKTFPEKILQKLSDIRAAVEKWQEKIDYYRAFIEREDFKRAFALCRKQLFCIWKAIRPRKCRADLHFGFDDPAVTGQVLGYLGMLYPFFGKDMVIRPDFENNVLEGKVLIKGRVTIFCLLRVLWILYFNKDIRRLIRVWKKEER